MKFSVIMPIYGVEQYLEECINSVLSQTYTDFELILVDDRSPDRCPAICDAFAQKDARVRVIHKPQNEGLGFARNTGLSAASGDYVLFVDSDDRIDENLLAECAENMEDGADILVFGVNFCYENKKGAVIRTETAIPERFIAKTKKEIAQMFAKLNQNRVFQYAWNKIYKRTFLLDAGVQFESTKLIEDFLFNIAVFPKADFIKSVDKAYYNYRKPSHETLASKYHPEFFDLCKRKYNLEKQFLKSCDALDEFQPLIHEMYIKHFVSVVIRNHSKQAGLSKDKEKALLLAMCEDEVTADAVSQYSPRGFVYKALCKNIQKKNVAVLRTLCFGIGFVQQNILPVLKKILSR